MAGSCHSVRGTVASVRAVPSRRCLAQPDYIVGRRSGRAAVAQHVDELRAVVRAVAAELHQRFDHRYADR